MVMSQKRGPFTWLLIGAFLASGWITHRHASTESIAKNSVSVWHVSNMGVRAPLRAPADIKTVPQSNALAQSKTLDRSQPSDEKQRLQQRIKDAFVAQNENWRYWAIEHSDELSNNDELRILTEAFKDSDLGVRMITMDQIGALAERSIQNSDVLDPGPALDLLRKGLKDTNELIREKAESKFNLIKEILREKGIESAQ